MSHRSLDLVSNMSALGNVIKHLKEAARCRQLLLPISHTPTTALPPGFLSPSSSLITRFIHNTRRRFTLGRSSVTLSNGVHHCRCMSMWTTRRPIPAHGRRLETLPGLWEGLRSNLNRTSVPGAALSNQSCVMYNSSADAEDVCADVHKRIVFMDDNIVAVNKPYGLSVFGNSSPKQLEKSPGAPVVSNNAVSIVKILPQLAHKINCLELDIGMSLKSFYSGLVLLCTHKGSMSKLKKVVAGSHTQKIQMMTYLAITVGLPQCPFGVDLTANIKRERLHNREMSIVSDTLCHSACKKGTMIQTCFSITPLAVNTSVGAALVQVTLNKDKWEAVEVLLSHYLSPVLSDHIYSSRTRMLAGVPCPASAHSAVPGPQRLPPTIEQLLQSNVDLAEGALPLCVHRHKVVLHQFPSRSSPPLVITAPPQKEFLTALQCLGLHQEGMFSTWS